MSLKIHYRIALLVGTLGILFFMGVFTQVYAEDASPLPSEIDTTVAPSNWGGEGNSHPTPTPIAEPVVTGAGNSGGSVGTNGNQTGANSAIGGESGNVSVGGSGNISVGGSGNTSVGGGSASLTNPLKATTISGFLLAVVDVILVFALPLIVLYIMYAGFLYVTARGEPGQITTARSALLWAIAGGVIVLGAKLIVSVIEGTIQAF